MRVVVLGGGRSSEHEVSLMSASSVLDGLERAGHETVFVLIGRDGIWREGEGSEPLAITPGGGLLGAEAVFPVLHGPFGEDGTVQGLLESADVPYVGAGVLGSAVCMDKGVFKGLMANEGMPQVRYEVVTEREWGTRQAATLDRLRGLGLPVFVKPSRLGSSVGISKVSADDELASAVEAALAHDPRVLVEAAADGIEVECAVIGNDEPVASGPGQVIAHGDWYDYEAKYTEAAWTWSCPPRSPPRSESGCAASRRRRSCGPRAAASRASTSSSPRGARCS